MPPGDPQNVPRGGRFIGASSGAFLDQMAADIYLQDIWTSQGVLYRVAVACVGWGLSVAMIQRTEAHEPGHPGPWVTANGLRHWLIVHDPGQQMVGVPVVPNPLPNHTPPGEGTFWVNGVLTIGPKLPWHHRLTLRVQPERGEYARLHYHKHEPRKDHRPDPPPIMPKNRGKHYVFDEIVYSTQLQNCRRAMPRQ
ncbi:hypothetical protein BV20DRAFT_1012624 [Pilatotrama ljubarskyi]|nr:hypothetical protein BV20DRAFT_1012624 [Pilatotrama ljubarskyi]